MEPQPKLELPLIRYLVELYYDYQDVRIRSANRLRQIDLKPPEQDEVGAIFKTSQTLEKNIYKILKPYVAHEKVWQDYLSRIRGIGPVLGAGLIAYIGDIGRFSNISKLWKYAGLHVVEGKAPKWRHGVKIDWNPKLRVLCWKIGSSFIKVGKAGRGIYEEFKKEETVKHERQTSHTTTEAQHDSASQSKSEAQDAAGSQDSIGDQEKDASHARSETQFSTAGYHQCKAPKLHIDLRARRRLVKVFLQCLWVRWRELEGLPITEPYVKERLGHPDIIKPEEWIDKG